MGLSGSPLFFSAATRCTGSESAHQGYRDVHQDQIEITLLESFPLPFTIADHFHISIEFPEIECQGIVIALAVFFLLSVISMACLTSEFSQH